MKTPEEIGSDIVFFYRRSITDDRQNMIDAIVAAIREAVKEHDDRRFPQGAEAMRIQDVAALREAVMEDRKAIKEIAVSRVRRSNAREPVTSYDPVKELAYRAYCEDLIRLIDEMPTPYYNVSSGHGSETMKTPEEVAAQVLSTFKVPSSAIDKVAAAIREAAAEEREACAAQCDRWAAWQQEESENYEGRETLIRIYGRRDASEKLADLIRKRP